MKSEIAVIAVKKKVSFLRVGSKYKEVEKWRRLMAFAMVTVNSWERHGRTQDMHNQCCVKECVTNWCK